MEEHGNGQTPIGKGTVTMGESGRGRYSDDKTRKWS